jgi:Zn-dependent peptidase ImmA (M78 family)/DNA-binding XRE family transcriptional regulator
MFDSSRLKLARQRLGWTLTQLSSESGVSVRSLSNYENSKGQEPSTETVEKLARALMLPASFLTREPVDVLRVEAVSFRKLSRTSAAKRDAVLASATIALDFFSFVEETLTLPTPDLPTYDKYEAEQAAELLRRRWNLGDKPISNMLHLLESKGVRVVGLSHDLAEIDAFSFARDGVPVVVLNTFKSGERQRFDLAHELGHLILHDEREMTPADSKDREAEANRFAAAFLMPRSGILAQDMRGASINRVLRARAAWKVSAMAMTHRLRDLGLMGDWQYRSMCIALSDAGYRSGEPGGMVPETSLLLRKVLFGNNKVQVSKAADRIGVAPRDINLFLRGLVPTVA